ncbi:MAG TPA: ABC transporter permease subunit, partial [Acidimicrobiales bacterium]
MTSTGISLPQVRTGIPAGLADDVEVGADADGAAVAAPAHRRPGSRATAGRWALRLASLAAAIGAWQLLSANDVDLWVRFSKVPPPSDVFAELKVQLGEGRFYHDLLASLRRILVGFGLATVTGVSLGVAIGRSKVASDLLRPVLEVVRPIPAIAWVPLAILLFPTGEQGIVFITYLAALFPVLVSTQHAVRALPNVWEDAVRTMGGSRLVILSRVVLPGALPG